jgi:hypothetical protein
MMSPSLRQLLAMRIIGEQARMEDLVSMLPLATQGQDDSNRDRYRTRINDRLSWMADVNHDADGWQGWVDGASDADVLVDELVALSMTQLLRSHGLDSGTFDAGESLVAELVDSAGLPTLVLGHTQLMEALDHTKATVSMRFPGSRIWDVAILGHEFGHHAVQELPHREPVHRAKRPLSELSATISQQLSEEGTKSWRTASHAEELLADCVAAAVCGPTYVIACLTLRVPPGVSAATESDTHPPWRCRVAAMREVLDALTEHTRLGRYRQQRESVIDPLASAILGSLPTPSAAAESAAYETVKRLRRHCPQLIYGEANLAIEVAERLTNRDPQPPDHATIRSVLDGAWRWRLARATRQQDPAIASIAVDYCREIVRRRKAEDQH